MSFARRGIVLAAICAGLPALAQDGVSITGTYVQNAACKGDGSDPAAKLVRITETDVHSSFGICTFVKKEHDGHTVAAQMSCNGPGGNILPLENAATSTSVRIAFRHSTNCGVRSIVPDADVLRVESKVVARSRRLVHHSFSIPPSERSRTGGRSAPHRRARPAD